MRYGDSDEMLLLIQEEGDNSPDDVYYSQGAGFLGELAAMGGLTPLPAEILDFTDPQWAGRIGYAPTNASFQDHVTAIRALEGEDAARAWLEGLVANGALPYENNTAILEAARTR